MKIISFFVHFYITSLAQIKPSLTYLLHAYAWAAGNTRITGNRSRSPIRAVANRIMKPWSFSVLRTPMAMVIFVIVTDYTSVHD